MVLAPECADALGIRALKRAKLVMHRLWRRRAEDQYSSASITTTSPGTINIQLKGQVGPRASADPREVAGCCLLLCDRPLLFLAPPTGGGSGRW